MPRRYLQPQNSNEALLAISKLPEKQLEVLGQIALNNDRGIPNRTIDALIAKGLVERVKRVDGPYVFFNYRTPIFVHMAWCEWASRNCKDEG